MHALNLYLGALRCCDPPAAAQPVLASARHCAQTMDDMFRALLDGARPDAGTAPALIVVVDDEALVRDATQLLLEQWGHEVVAASGGGEIIALLSGGARVPDAIVCDHRLRGGETGIDVVRRLREEFNSDIPALLVTGDTAPERIKTILATGLPILYKPLRDDVLRDALDSLLNR